MKKNQTHSANVRLPLVAGLLITLSGCAGSGGLFMPAPIASRAVLNNGVVVPDFVQNLPKSATGNMAQYTVFGKQYRTLDTAESYDEQGIASWYGKKFHGRKTSSGEIYNMFAMTAAHKSLPLPTFVRVTNLDNNQSVVVKVNDRGPFVGDRVIDMSYTSAKLLGMVEQGTANVRVEALSTHLVAGAPAGTQASSQVSSQASAQAQTRAVPVPQTITQTIASNQVRSPSDQSANAPSNATAAALASAKQAAAARQVNREAANQLRAQRSVDIIPAQKALPQSDINIDSSEDGFVASPELSTGSLADTTNVAIEEPAEVSALNEEDRAPQPQTSRASGGNVYIQLGAFSDSVNAFALVTDVDEKTGLAAFVERDDARNLFRVKMGPFKEGDLLKKSLEELASIGIDSYIKLAGNN